MKVIDRNLVSQCCSSPIVTKHEKEFPLGGSVWYTVGVYEACEGCGEACRVVDCCGTCGEISCEGDCDGSHSVS